MTEDKYEPIQGTPTPVYYTVSVGGRYTGYRSNFKETALAHIKTLIEDGRISKAVLIEHRGTRWVIE